MPMISTKTLRSNRKAIHSAPPAVSRIEWAVWIGASTTVFGVTAWCAGEAYASGYWGAVGLTTGAAQYSIQELTFLGFVGSFQNWLWLLFSYALTGLYILFLEFLSTFKKKPARPSGKFRLWLQNKAARFERQGRIDPHIKRICGVVLLASIGLGAFVVAPLGVWISAAEADGHQLMVRQICQARAAVKMPTNVLLSDGKKLSGRFLARNDKTGMLLDRTSLYGIQFGEKSVLQDVTDVTMVTCKR